MAGSPARRKLFVLSDWHLGGSPDAGAVIGTQICRSIDQLTTFIHWVASEAEAYAGTTEIIINGDMVDFLAPDGAEPAVEWMADQDHAVRHLERIVAGAQGPFQALRKFLDGKRTEVTVALGNHDVELSLPLVRVCLRKILGDSPRFRMVYDGEAIVRGRVLIEHGNRYDAWNVLNHDSLREERSHVSRGLPIEEAERANRFFRPPAGSYLVVYAFNTLLAEAPFLNLLKPETQAALPLLIALEPNLGRVLANILRWAPPVVSRYGVLMQSAAVPADRGNLTGDRSVSISTLDQALRPLLGNETDLFLNPPVSELGAAAGATTALAWIRARAVAIAHAVRGRLDLGAMMRDAKHEARGRLLEIAFTKLRDDDSFRLDQEKPEYIEAAKELLGTGKFDVVVFGHTHLQKVVAIPRAGRADGHYLNTGTWADTMRLPAAVTAGGTGARQALAGFFDQMAARNIRPYLFTSLGYAEIELADDTVASAAVYSFTSAKPRSDPQTPRA